MPQPSSSTASATGGNSSSSGSRSEFSQLAGEIGKALSQTSSKLQRLTRLASRKSLFDDPAEEINELTFVVKQDIQNLNSALERLAEVRRGGRGGNSNAQTEAHSGSVVDVLKGRLMDTTKVFKDVLQTRSGNIKAQSDRKKHFGQAERSSPGVGGGGPQPVRRPNAGPDPSTSSVSIPIPTQQQQQQQLVLQQDGYHQSRANAVETIESTIVELGSIFTQLATMVSEQGEMVQRIDENVADAETNIQGAHNQLLRYMDSVSSNRALILKILAILMVFIVAGVALS